MHSDPGRCLIRLKELSVGYGPRIILSGISFSLPPASFVLIEGPNGTGKTTLARLLLRLIPPVKGSLQCNWRQAAYLPQQHNLDRQFPLAIYDLVAMGQKPGYFLPPRAAKKRPGDSSRNSKKTSKTSSRQTIIQEALASVNLADQQNLHFDQVSGGQLQRALIARALLSQPDFLILDEPFGHLDQQGQIDLADFLLEKNQKEKMTICVIDHLNEKDKYRERPAYTHRLQVAEGQAHLHNVSRNENRTGGLSGL